MHSKNFWILMGLVLAIAIFLIFLAAIPDKQRESVEVDRSSGLVINDQDVVTGIVTQKYKFHHDAIEFPDNERHCFLGVTYAGESMLPIFENGRLTACDADSEVYGIDLHSTPECLSGLTTMRKRIFKKFIRFYVYNIETNMPYNCMAKDTNIGG